MIFGYTIYMAGAQWYFRKIYKTHLTDVFFQTKLETVQNN
jgi:hypothetical protein